MADLVCVAFDDPTTADRALTDLTALQKEFVIQLKDACVVVRSPMARFTSTRRCLWSGPGRSPAAPRARFGAR
jgi:uncharacterized membrane protein